MPHAPITFKFCSVNAYYYILHVGLGLVYTHKQTLEKLKYGRINSLYERVKKKDERLNIIQ
ncbi:hypothetical protein HanXRQr2_Chr17g0802521 [Helianthus annuus]|uniref:Uncharacterized protein n=1 Tax=Helianthus annuus TaxID=4232 RepID=A0A9K3GUL7_HELAN|nr:hypothetical protein HanXRQr2_Chr17g0802521 [Helianthus annuus]KAJ0813138.1 hypothetical protein HanPSC8_Chr17g0770051 [Helianthus annuus]